MTINRLNNMTLPMPLGLTNDEPLAIKKNVLKSRQPTLDSLRQKSSTLAALQQTDLASLSPAQKQLAQSSLNKIQNFSQACASTDGLDSAIALILAQMSKQADQQADQAKNAAYQKMQKAVGQLKAELAELQKKNEAEESSSWWSDFCDVFKTIGTAAAIVGAVCSGPVGIAAASLMIASIITQKYVPGDTGKWLSLGLAVGGALCGGAAAFMPASGLTRALGQGAAVAGKAANITAAAAGAGSAAGCMVKAHYDSAALTAQANIEDLRALTKKMLNESGEERDLLEKIVEAQDRCVRAGIKAMENQHRAIMAAPQHQRA